MGLAPVQRQVGPSSTAPLPMASAEAAALVVSLPPNLPPALAEDIAALSARIAKEHALQALPTERAPLAVAAAAAS